jgi:hypothetical protein
MRVPLACLLALAAACDRAPASLPPAAIGRAPSPTAPAPHSDERAPTVSLRVSLNGHAVAQWSPSQVTAIAPVHLRSREGDDRTGWPLGDLAHALAGPGARVVALVGEGGRRVTVDGSAGPVLLRVTRHGEYKAQLLDGEVAGDTLLRKVDAVELER